MPSRSTVELDRELLIRFAHDAAKPVRAMILRLEMMLEAPSAVQDDPDTIRIWERSFNCIRQAFDDFQCLVLAGTETKESWESVEWRALVNPFAAKWNKRPNVTVDIASAALRSHGNPALIRQALAAVAWFADHFGQRLTRFSLRAGDQGETPAVILSYELEATENINPEIEQLAPFCSLSNKSMAIDSNSGLMLYAPKRVMELHGGALRVKASGRRLTIEMTCPRLITASEG